MSSVRSTSLNRYEGRDLHLGKAPKAPRRAKAPAPRESDIQSAIVDYLRTVLTPNYRVVAIPNASRRTAGRRASNAVAGLSAGFPDLMIVCRLSGAFFAEVKTDEGRLSPEQVGWQRWFGIGRQHAIWRSVEDARASLKSWGIPTREAA